MKDKNPTQQQTPPNLPLTGEEQELERKNVCQSGSLNPSLTRERQELTESTVRLISETIKQSNTAPPLSRGGREGFAFVPYNNSLTALARENRKNPTAAESKLWKELLRMRNFSNLKFSRQKPIANYIADFYCASLHLAIEIDGDSHAESVEYDAERTKTLLALGVTVIRYTNGDILKNLPGVYDDMMRKIAMMEEEVVKQ